jgi:hypothetical protein
MAKISETETFRDLAPELEVDEDEKLFEERVRKIAPKASRSGEADGVTLFQLLQGMGLTAVLLTLGLGVPVSAFLYLRRKPRRFLLWPIFFAATAGALAPPFNVVAFILTQGFILTHR